MKDYFGGNIIRPRDLFYELLVVSGIMFCLSVFFFWTALFYEHCDYNTRIGFLIFAVFTLTFSIGYLPLTIYIAKRRKKYPFIAKCLVKPDRFIE